MGLPIYLYLVMNKTLTSHNSVKLHSYSQLMKQIPKQNADPFSKRKRVSVLNIDARG